MTTASEPPASAENPPPTPGPGSQPGPGFPPPGSGPAPAPAPAYPPPGYPPAGPTPPAPAAPAAWGAPGPWAQVPPAPTAPPEGPPVTRADLIAGVAVVAVLAVFGVLVGLLWSAVATRPQGVIYQAGGQSALDFAHYESDEFFAGDGWFLFLTLGAGVLVGLVAWLVRPVRGPVLVVALTLGSLLASYLAWRTGRIVSYAGTGRALVTHNLTPGTRLHLPLRLRAKVVLLAQAFGAVAVYVSCAAWSSRADLGARSGRKKDGSVGAGRDL
jgi:hypothetical protein